MNPDPNHTATASGNQSEIHHEAADLPANPGKALPAFLRARDVLLVSYPRSGNTWMRYLLANLFFPLKSWHIGNINRVVPDLGETFPEDYLDPNPRIFKTHYPRLTRHRAIYLYRDGRDAALSYYDRLCKLRGEDRPFSTFLKEMLSGNCKFGAWQDHVDSWMDDAASGRILSVCYESMYQDPLTELRRVKEFLGKNWTDRSIRRAVKRSNIRHFRRHMMRYHNSHWEKGFSGGIQRGPGYWKAVFTPELNDMFWNFAGPAAARLGYPREYPKTPRAVDCPSDSESRKDGIKTLFSS